MTERKKYLNAKDFQAGEWSRYMKCTTSYEIHRSNNANHIPKGLVALDREMGQNVWLAASAPIQLITAGGFLAVSYLKNRDSTGDVDYLIHPEFAADKDIQNSLHSTIRTVARQLQYDDDWINEALAIFVTPKA